MQIRLSIWLNRTKIINCAWKHGGPLTVWLALPGWACLLLQTQIDRANFKPSQGRAGGRARLHQPRPAIYSGSWTACLREALLTNLSRVSVCLAWFLFLLCRVVNFDSMCLSLWLPNMSLASRESWKREKKRDRRREDVLSNLHWLILICLLRAHRETVVEREKGSDSEREKE